MRHRSLCLTLPLLLTLASAPLAATDLRGSSRTALSDRFPSLLGGVDLQALEQAACFAGPIRGSVLVITNDGGGTSALTVDVLATRPGDAPGTALAQVRPAFLHLAGGEPLAFSCGQFAYFVTLDPDVAQPISELTLVSDPGTTTSGTCTGVLAVAARLVLRPLAGGLPLHAARPMKLRISGRWTLAEGDIAAGESPLVLFALRQQDGRVRPQPECLGDADPDTSLCFEAAGSAVSNVSNIGRPRE
jgi:hypothetical protein